MEDVTFEAIVLLLCSYYYIISWTKKDVWLTKQILIS